MAWVKLLSFSAPKLWIWLLSRPLLQLQHIPIYACQLVPQAYRTICQPILNHHLSLELSKLAQWVGFLMLCQSLSSVRKTCWMLPASCILLYFINHLTQPGKLLILVQSTYLVSELDQPNLLIMCLIIKYFQFQKQFSIWRRYVASFLENTIISEISMEHLNDSKLFNNQFL